MKPTTLTYDKAGEVIGLDKDEESELLNVEANRKFYHGDHWQGGDGWLGPGPAEGNPEAEEVFDRIERGFVSANKIAEIVNRKVRAVIGHNPDWSLGFKAERKQIEEERTNPLTGEKLKTGRMMDAPYDDKESLHIKEVNSPLVAWWDKRKILKVMQDVATMKEWGARGYGRMFVPRGDLEEATDDKGRTFKRVRQREFSEMMMRLFLETPDLEDARMLLDRETMETFGVCRYELDDDAPPIIEVSFLDDDGKTYIVTLKKESGAEGNTREQTAIEKVVKTKEARAVEAAAAVDGDEDEETDQPSDISASEGLDLNGHLTLYEVKGKPLVSPQMRQQNKLVNMALTTMGHNVLEAGFSERATTNVELDDEASDEEQLEAGDGRERRAPVRPARTPRGAGVTSHWVGIQYEKQKGQYELANPGVYWKDPAPVQTFTDTHAEATWNMLEEAQQLHALLSGAASPSGESRIQALADFVISCLDLKTEMDDFGKWIIECAMAMAAQFSGDPGKYNDLRCNFDCKIDVGKLTAEDKKQLMSEVDKKLRSRRAYQLLVGISDPDLENQTILEEEKAFEPLKDVQVKREKLGLATDKVAFANEKKGGTGDGGGGGAGA